jgi:chromosome partitioning protein
VGDRRRLGKTINTVHIATALGELGRKCLIWDLDMNHRATMHFGIPSESFLGTYEMLMGDERPEDLILTSDEDGIELPRNLHLIPARRNVENIDEALAARDKFLNRPDVLIDPLNRLRGKYDYIFLDTAPNATTPTIAAYEVGKVALRAVDTHPGLLCCPVQRYGGETQTSPPQGGDLDELLHAAA